MALAFPDLYEIGTSHFGMQILYHIVNQQPLMMAERVFAPADDMARLLREHNQPLLSLESQTPLAQFDIIGFSLLYELNYTNVLNMLDLSNLAFRSAQRRPRDPIIIAGGPCACNPEPVADFFDAIVIGDGEHVILQMAHIWLDWQKNTPQDKPALLQQWASLTGVYVPRLYESRSPGASPPNIQRAILADLDTSAFPDRPVIPFGRPIHDRLRIEIARGCTRGCRFCQAGMIYRPVREKSVETLLQLTRQALKHTGYDDISLLSLSTGDYNQLNTLMQHMIGHCRQAHVAISLPSLRAGTLTPEVMGLIKRIRKTGFTIAPEAGSQRLRDVINKNITEADIFQTVAHAFELGWQVIKLYFMIGLPTETQADLEEMVDMVIRLADLKKKQMKNTRRGKINVSITPFIPKPHTPFQWQAQLTPQAAWEKIDWIKQRLARSDIHVKWQNPQTSQIEGLFSRGDRRLSRLLETAWRLGCGFDGWSDHFNYARWQQAIDDAGVDVDACISEPRPLDRPLPWDHIDIGVDKQYLIDEYQRALTGQSTPDCRWGECSGCGVCDFQTIMPRIDLHADQTAPPAAPAPVTDATETKLDIIFSKRDQARFFGHLEMVNMFMRAFKRADIALKYSGGFHPKAKMAFQDALPVGIESDCERLVVVVIGQMDADAIMRQLNRQLPQGLSVKRCRIRLPGMVKPVPTGHVYDVEIDQDGFANDRLQPFEQCAQWVIQRRSHKGGARAIDMKAHVESIQWRSARAITIVFRPQPQVQLRPREILEHLFELDQQVIQRARILKRQ